MAPAACILGCAGVALAPDEAAFLREADPWGFILFARNVDTPDSLRALTSGLREAVGRAAPILVDQEGGRVQRLRAPHWTEWLPPLDMAQAVAASGRDVAAAFRLRYAIIGADLRAVGIDVNCVPSGDVASNATHPFLRNRCYGTDPATVAARATAAAAGCIAGGVLPVLKHMPGHGRAVVDSHHDMPRVDAPLDELRADFAAFRGVDAALGMTAHVVYSAIDDAPGTVSPAVIRVIREDIGFTGILMTDDVSMAALGGPVADRAGRAIAAGCDLVLHCNGDMAEMAGVVAACGTTAAPVPARPAAPDPAAVADWRAGLAVLLR